MKKKSKHIEHENHERWLVSYADFITLLFAFFVVMYATSNNNEEKQKTFQESVRANLKLAFVSQNQGGQGLNSADAIVPELINPIDGFPKQGGPREIEDYIGRQLDKNMDKEEKQSGISALRHDSIGVRISLAAATFFQTGSAKMKASGLKTLDRVAELLKQTDKRLIIEGHTDDLPILGGQYESNWELASMRATTVVRYLTRVHQIDAKRLAAISYADQKPVAPNDTEENRAKNRRIEILIVTDEKAAL